MRQNIIVKAGQCSHAGIKPSNQDCCGIRIPEGSVLEYKGIVAVVADGVGSSAAGREASEHCVKSFISDYYSSPDSWAARRSGETVTKALNSWLYNQGQKLYEEELSLASTLSALVLKSTTAYLFHVGDTRIQLIRQGVLKPLTRDHHIIAGPKKRYLARAMGADSQVNVDYYQLDLQPLDIFILTTDGVHESLSPLELKELALDEGNNLEERARRIVAQAVERGSQDNTTCQILQIESLPNEQDEAFYEKLTALPFPPPLKAGDRFEGYEIIKELHASSKVQVYLAQDLEQKKKVVIKTPSINYEDDLAYIQRFTHEEWVGKALSSPRVLKVLAPSKRKNFLYYVTDYVEGETLAQWILDHPLPPLQRVREFTAQIIEGLRAFQRREMVHQDLKPENILLDAQGQIKLIDFGCVFVAGLQELYSPVEDSRIQGTEDYIAPEVQEGFAPTYQADLYALGVTVYEMLTGKMPYPPKGDLRLPGKREYRPARLSNPLVPIWMDETIKKAVCPQPQYRYESFSEFFFDLNNPNPAFFKHQAPLMERDPLTFWKGFALLLFLLNVLWIFLLAQGK